MDLIFAATVDSVISLWKGDLYEHVTPANQYIQYTLYYFHI